MEKGCDYCKPQKEDVYGNGSGKYIDGLGDKSGMWFIMTNGKHILRSHGSEIVPKYCPMCGRILNTTK